MPWWWLILALVAAAAGAWLVLRTRAAAQRADAEDAEDEAGEIAETAASVREVPPPASVPPIAPLAPSQPLALQLHPERLSVSLVNATLHYRLAVTNLSGAPLGPIAIAADMIGAHASIPAETQLGQDGGGLELRHELAALGAGETAEMRGELRLPLAQVTPIRSGAATLLVPLVRLRVEAGRASFTSAVVVGETPPVDGAPLRPFRLDTGPRIFGSVSQREVAVAA